MISESTLQVIRSIRRSRCLAPLLAPLLAAALVALPQQGASAETAQGTVFHDRNGNQKRDAGEEGLPNIRVSNQKEIVFTDSQGRWSLPCTQDTTFFVIKPRGWKTPLTPHNLPQFYYIHKPEGSPKTQFPGVAPTGPLPVSIDFPLEKQEEPEQFHALFFGDTQPRNVREVDYITHDVVEELIGASASFGVTLGDIVFDDLSVFEPLNAAIALIGIPWFNVIGNHDINYDSPNDLLSDETYTRYYGPNYYSFDYGPVHFIVLDNILWGGQAPNGTGKYTGGLGPDQIRFVKEDLKQVPNETLVLLMMHIPITNTADREDLFRLIEDRPHTLSISGHTHWQEHLFLKEEQGWKGKEPHHHVISVTVCGSWWAGEPNELGIPHTMMRDGAPNGYTLIHFDGHKTTIEFKAAQFPKDYQMNLHLPDSVSQSETGNTTLFANVFGGSERTQVSYQINDHGDWTPLEKTLEPDPYFLRLKEIEANRPPAEPYRKLPEVIKSSHLWKGKLPCTLPLGTHQIQVRAIEENGQIHRSSRLIRVTQ